MPVRQLSVNADSIVPVATCCDSDSQKTELHTLLLWLCHRSPVSGLVRKCTVVFLSTDGMVGFSILVVNQVWQHENTAVPASACG